MPKPLRLLLLSVLVLAVPPGAAAAPGITVLSYGKKANLRSARGVIRVAKDPALLALPDPSCPTATAVELSSYPQATQLVEVALRAELACEGWSRRGKRWRWKDPSGTSGVRRVVLGERKLAIRLGGAGYTMPAAPAGYVQAWFEIGDQRLNARFHQFARNDAGRIVTRKPSKAAAAGEAGFWAILHGDVPPAEQAAHEEATFAALAEAARRNPRDGRSRFLTAMLHLYRFGQATPAYHEVGPEAEADLAAAAAAFEEAVPLLWDGTRGDTRVPGFAASTKFVLGLVQGNAALEEEGMADLDAAFLLNPLFNVFDYIPVIQFVPRSDPRFQGVFDKVDAYLSDPNTVACFGTQPETCADAGYAPRNTAGALALFGDVQAKGGNALAAESWYGLALGLAQGGANPYPFLAALEARAGHAAERVALYEDEDPLNDPPVLGAGAETCATCHVR